MQPPWNKGWRRLALERGEFMLNAEVALVTGASRGIGAAIAARLASDGARVIGTATSVDGAARITAALAAQGGRGAVLDVTRQESIDALMADIETHEGAVGILCNNAGITRDMLLLRMKDQDWDLVMQTNLASVFRLSKAVLRGMMKARKGRIISIASIVGSIGNPGQANYAAAKAGMIGFTKSLAREVGSRGITVNVVAPGFIDTDMTRSLTDAQKGTLNSQIPLARLGQPSDIAAAVAFLASPDAAYITGETLHVNGGMHMC
jgi:3-oxoacyl-[acyl-carrier protein] reductase